MVTGMDDFFGRVVDVLNAALVAPAGTESPVLGSGLCNDTPFCSRWRSASMPGGRTLGQRRPSGAGDTSL
jgi:hypothetical protein